MHDPKLKEEFARHLADVRGRSRATVETYRREADAFLSYAASKKLSIAEAMTRTNATLYIMERTEERKRREGELPQLSARSAARSVSALKAFAKFLVFSGALKKNEIASLKPPKYSRKLPAYYQASEILKLIDAFEKDPSPQALRNSAILAVLYGTGMRVGECCGLDVLSVEAMSGFVRVLGKGNKQRDIPFSKAVAERVKHYLSSGRAQLTTAKTKGSHKKALWLNRFGTRLTKQSVNDILDKAALAAGFAKPVTPHKLRHACATHMLEGGADVRLLQDFLGHQSIDTTQVYTQITRTMLRDVYLNSHPRAKK